MCSPRFLPLVALAAAFLAGLPARAEGPARSAVTQARSLFERGAASLDAGRYDAACHDLEASQALDPHPGTLFALAECEEKRGHRAAAVARYDAYLALYPTLSPNRKARQGDREAMARAARDRLGPRVAELTLALVPSAAAGTVVTRDGALVEARSLGVPVPVEPGEHVVTVQAPGGAATETRIVLAAGDKRGVALEAPPLLPTWAVALGSAGVAGIVVGSIAGILALQRANQPACTPASGCGTGAVTLARVADVAFIGGGAALISALVPPFAVWLRARPSAAPAKVAPSYSIRVSPRGIILGGTW